MGVARAAPWGARPPLGRLQDTRYWCLSASGRRLGRRICLRRGCGHSYQAQRWNQRYCQRPECLKLVRRWQAAKRQEERRRRPEARAAHAVAERQRRACRRAERGKTTSSEQSADDHDQGAWSRSKKFSAPFCDRPGCYDAVRASCRCQARYCSDACRQAVLRVRDRERKWLDRNTQAGRLKRRFEYQADGRAQKARSP